MDSDEIPTIGTYRGVPLEDRQSDVRLARVRAEIDLVLGMSDPGELADYAGNPWHAPEARQLAAAMAETAWTVAAETRALRPNISLEKLYASVAGLGSRTWRCPFRHATLLEDGGVEREQPLDDLEQ
jgi:hypothetical protein